ncbi:MAG: family 2 glycosyl transferase [Methylocystaceae bacterium]|nr:MAG: family 2 glycosyl transferase [Methylocystaceae bacterium]
MGDRVSPAAEIAAPVTAIVTAYQRIEQTLDTLRRIEACRPRPDEILVHVDGNEVVCADAVRAAFAHLTVIVSETSVGPGGGRNKLVAAARNKLIASFDDDSYPIDTDFFDRARTLAETFPDAALFAASIFHKNEARPEDMKVASHTASFGAGGVVFRRSEFLAAGGFVPLVVAYGMEEEDLALRLLNRGRTLLRSPWLRVFHDTDLSHHSSARITSGVIANLALLAWLRYPVSYWPYGVLQVANRVVWCIRVGRRTGILTGLAAIPPHLARHRSLRNPVSKEAMRQRVLARTARLKPFSQYMTRRRSAPQVQQK